MMEPFDLDIPIFHPIGLQNYRFLLGAAGRYEPYIALHYSTA